MNVFPRLLNLYYCPFPLYRLSSVCSKSVSKESFLTMILKLAFKKVKTEKRKKED